VTSQSRIAADEEMTTEKVTFDADSCTLAGIFTDVPRPVAAALLIAGSGKTDRDSDVRQRKSRQPTSPEVLAIIAAWVRKIWGTA